LISAGWLIFALFVTGSFGKQQKTRCSITATRATETWFYLKTFRPSLAVRAIWRTKPTTSPQIHEKIIDKNGPISKRLLLKALAALRAPRTIPGTTISPG
jgi:hypothetical protein